jgi:hypothetical protein
MTATTVGTSNVEGSTGVVKIRNIKAGAAISINQWCYLDESVNKWKLTDADALATASGTIGLACTPGIDGGDITVQTEGDVTMAGASGTAGVPQFLHSTAGAMGPASDLGSGKYTVYVGGWKTATLFSIKVHALGVAQ